MFALKLLYSQRFSFLSFRLGVVCVHLAPVRVLLILAIFNVHEFEYFKEYLYCENSVTIYTLNAKLFLETPSPRDFIEY